MNTCHPIYDNIIVYRLSLILCFYETSYLKDSLFSFFNVFVSTDRTKTMRHRSTRPRPGRDSDLSTTSSPAFTKPTSSSEDAESSEPRLTTLPWPL